MNPLPKSKEEIVKEIREYPLGNVKVAVTDIDGVLRGKVIHRDKCLSALESGFGFCDVVFGWDAGDALYDNTTVTGWHTGYPDAEARIDMATFRRVPWDNDIPFFLADFSKGNDEGLGICPRNLLKRVRREAESLGFIPTFSQEFEWFNFRAGAELPTPITTGMFGYSLLRPAKNREYFNDLFHLLTRFGIPLEGLHTETGPGVYEAAILYSDILEAADRATLFKTGVKEIATRHGITPSFMAKWNSGFPGCGGHIHQSLWDREHRNNLFYDRQNKNNMSTVMQQYLAGQLQCMPHLLPLYAPTVNSYKRLVEGTWAPTTVTWGMDNRTTAARVLTSSPAAARVELRVVGADVNPYLAMAASLASGLYGIRNKLELKESQVVGSAYSNRTAPPLSRNLSEATQRMKDSPIAAQLLGEVFVQHFTRTREWEWKKYSESVTDWELKRYLEII